MQGCPGIQASIDIDYMNKGNSYQLLPESTVIFICTFDPFKQGVCRYTFTECCEEVSGLELKDGTTKIFSIAAIRERIFPKNCRSFMIILKMDRPVS